MRIVFCLIIALFVGGCSNPPYRGKGIVGADEFVIDSYKIRDGKFAILQMQGVETVPFPKDLLDEYKDRIHDGDVLKIILYHPTRQDLVGSLSMVNQSMGFKVSEKKVNLPELGAVEVEGLTLDEAREKIQASYQREIHNTEIFVDYIERIQRKVELAGLVQTPALPVDGRMRLYEALAVAKVPPNANLFKSYMIREGSLLAVDFHKLLKEGDMSQNVVLRGGDKIYIAEPSATTLMVLGEVGKERVVDLPNGFMTLRQALAEAGGIAPTGNRAYIQVIRGNILHPKIYTLHWQHVIALPSDSMLLIPGDIVYVAATPITEWNRFVTQLLPTFIAIDLISKGIKSIGVNVP